MKRHIVRNSCYPEHLTRWIMWFLRHRQEDHCVMAGVLSRLQKLRSRFSNHSGLSERKTYYPTFLWTDVQTNKNRSDMFAVGFFGWNVVVTNHRLSLGKKWTTFHVKSDLLISFPFFPRSDSRDIKRFGGEKLDVCRRRSESKQITNETDD